jgi:Helix-turn-helix
MKMGAARVKTEREARNGSLAELEECSGVSKAMISKIERNEASATMSVLGRPALLPDTLRGCSSARRPNGDDRRHRAAARLISGFR